LVVGKLHRHHQPHAHHWQHAALQTVFLQVNAPSADFAEALGRGRGLPKMEVLTLPIWKTSTCLTLRDGEASSGRVARWGRCASEQVDGLPGQGVDLVDVEVAIVPAHAP